MYPLGSIVTFETEENFHTENVQFDVTDVNLPFNAIIGRPALYRFMAIAHYGYLVLKMSSPAGVLTVRGDRAATLAAVEKLHTLAAEIARPNDGGRSPLTSGAKVPSKAPKVQPSGVGDGPAKTIQVGADPSQPPASRTIWERNRNSHSSPSSRQMLMYSLGNCRRCLVSPGR
jgi:hypothetical protein